VQRAGRPQQRLLLVIDGDSFAHRAYHGVPKSVVRRGGKGASAIVGLANLLLRLERPRAVLVGWDTLTVPTYRHKIFPALNNGCGQHLRRVKRSRPRLGNGREPCRPGRLGRPVRGAAAPDCSLVEQFGRFVTEKREAGVGVQRQ
jgi:hypothetical protein